MGDTIESLTADERQWLVNKEGHALANMRRYLGDNLRFHRTDADLRQIQLMIDDGVYDAEGDDLYAFGVVLGNVFDAQTSMKWAVVTNQFGRNIAVHDPAIAFTLYPIQMIAKRIEDGRAVNVPDLYQSFVNDLGIGPPPPK